MTLRSWSECVAAIFGTLIGRDFARNFHSKLHSSVRKPSKKALISKVFLFNLTRLKSVSQAVREVASGCAIQRLKGFSSREVVSTPVDEGTLDTFGHVKSMALVQEEDAVILK